MRRMNGDSSLQREEASQQLCTTIFYFLPLHARKMQRMSIDAGRTVGAENMSPAAMMAKGISMA